MQILGIIPARYSSTRFPGKPLVEIDGKPMIQRVYEQASKAKMLSKVVVATDDERIFNCVKQFGEVVLTGSHHQSGTDRCAEVLSKIGEAQIEVVINIQGDEPFIHPEQIDLLANCFQDAETQIATLAKKLIRYEDLFNPNIPKVIINKNNEAIYFSRSVIPYCRGVEEKEWLKKHIYYKHIGIYAYRANVLKTITQLSQSSLELAESLEQLRWIENGYKIKVALTDYESVSIDTPGDLKKIKKEI